MKITDLLSKESIEIRRRMCSEQHLSQPEIMILWRQL